MKLKEEYIPTHGAEEGVGTGVPSGRDADKRPFGLTACGLKLPISGVQHRQTP